MEPGPARLSRDGGIDLSDAKNVSRVCTSQHMRDEILLLWLLRQGSSIGRSDRRLRKAPSTSAIRPGSEQSLGFALIASRHLDQLLPKLPGFRASSLPGAPCRAPQRLFQLLACTQTCSTSSVGFLRGPRSTSIISTTPYSIRHHTRKSSPLLGIGRNGRQLDLELSC